ncbi:hypothetical protein N7535_001817 [Penicillium sp. DV-2018c]|nr:hypothetical protein N7461_004942 [Penicillium sp. DV-2018c]KAJ5583197.1 hypothetical protein N7535_001817 [Penicillium sp. DV-2018c]
MSGAEVIAVVACVAAVVSAYSDGTRMFHAIKKKYREKRRQSDQSDRELEWSLRRGPHEIESRFQQYRQELGPRYKEYDDGDSIAREQMKDIIIKLQGAMLKHLREAQERGTTLDLMALQIESEQGRVRTLVVLGDLYHRLVRPSPVPGFFSMSVDPAYRREEAFRHGYQPSSPDVYLPSLGLSSSGYPFTARGPVREEIRGSPTEAFERPRGPDLWAPPRRRWSSGFGSVMNNVSDRFHHRPSRDSTPSFSSPSSAPDPEPQFFQQNRAQTLWPSSTEPIPELDVRPATPTRKPIPRLSPFPHDELSGNPWAPDSDDESDFAHHNEETNHHLSPTSPPNQLRTNSLSAPSIASTDSTRSNPSTASSTDPPPKAIRPLWPPSKTNNYLGFCKGAWKVHAGFGGFKIYREPGTGYYTQRSWLRCAKCAFEAPLAPGKNSSHNPQFEDSVRTHKRTGIRYRYEFLAKSHVPCKRDAAAHFTPDAPRGAFCCVFCCAMAKGSTQVFGNLDTFMAHLAEMHWGGDGGILDVLPSTKCVVGRVALDSEYFDVNIRPPRNG